KKWPEALAAARRAEALLADGGAEALRQRVRVLLADLAMVARLEEVELQKDNMRDHRFDYELAAAEYTKAFREFGIDVEALAPAEAAARLRARTIPVELAAALDAWAGAHRSAGNAGGRWQHLVAVARLADPDERRNQLRDALARRDRKTL